MSQRNYLYISKVAELFQVHPQTLRLYEKEGLIHPKRSKGNTRLYDQDTLERIRLILTLTRQLGVNLAGVEIILSMREKLLHLQEMVDQLIQWAQREERKLQATSTVTTLATRRKTSLALVKKHELS